jgi:hypothetical protein
MFHVKHALGIRDQGLGIRRRGCDKHLYYKTNVCIFPEIMV